MRFLHDYLESRQKFRQLQKVSRAGFEKLSATERLSVKNDIEQAEDLPD
jgi:hypothetical protein